MQEESLRHRRRTHRHPSMEIAVVACSCPALQVLVPLALQVAPRQDFRRKHPLLLKMSWFSAVTAESGAEVLEAPGQGLGPVRGCWFLDAAARLGPRVLHTSACPKLTAY